MYKCLNIIFVSPVQFACTLCSDTGTEPPYCAVYCLDTGTELPYCTVYCLDTGTELPYCTICLERMDESVSTVLTILCNHKVSFIQISSENINMF